MRVSLNRRRVSALVLLPLFWLARRRTSAALRRDIRFDFKDPRISPTALVAYVLHTVIVAIAQSNIGWDADGTRAPCNLRPAAILFLSAVESDGQQLSFSLRPDGDGERAGSAAIN